MKKKVCVVTGARSEYGLLYWLMKTIRSDPVLTLQIVATAMHLSPEFGLTYKEILEDGFSIDEKIEMLLSSDTATAVTKSIGLGVIGFADAYARLKPDMLILLGDRFETLAAAQAALIAKIPIVHIHGGELSLGAIDDAIRHSITKMSHLHFVACETYRQRVIQLGENPSRVFNVGAMVLDAITEPALNRTELAQTLGITFRKRNFLITYHPETLGNFSSQAAFEVLLNALHLFEETTFLFTEANADVDGRIINEMIKDFCDQHSQAYSFQALGQRRYLSLLKHVDLMIGNSSSGIIEAPYYQLPTVNIGNRQTGRIKPLSVIDCQIKLEDILAAIDRALSQEHQQKMETMPLPYGQGKVAHKIVDVIKNTNLFELVNKQFYHIHSI